MRKKHSLDGAWQFQVDASEKGQKDKWFMNGLPDSTAIMVPHIWQTDEKYVTYSGAAWYEKELNIGVKQDDIQYWLHFDAVDYEASVWLNGQYLGRHEGGFTPFSYNVTAVLKSNINKVTVRVYDPNDNAEIPIGKQGSWYTRVSGIWQSVYIEERREQFIESALVTPIIKENAVSVKTETHGVTEDAELTFLISEHLNKELIFKEETQIIKEQQSNIQLSWKDINLWSPDSPYLYDLTIILKKDGEVLDEYEVTFGMREVTYRDGMVYLNGEPLYIRGALDQSFYPDTVYNPLLKSGLLMKLIKQNIWVSICSVSISKSKSLNTCTGLTGSEC
jgi:beta-galactosidase/beta-glucuronidase